MATSSSIEAQNNYFTKFVELQEKSARVFKRRDQIRDQFLKSVAEQVIEAML